MHGVRITSEMSDYEIKTEIAEVTGVRIEQQRLFCNGEEVGKGES